MDLLPESCDPFDLYFNFTMIRYSRPGEPVEVPRSQFLAANGLGLKSPRKDIKRMKIVIGKKDDGPWGAPFNMFYNHKTVICDFDAARNLVKAVMLDGSGEVGIQNANSFDAAGRLTHETVEVFDNAFGPGAGKQPKPRILMIESGVTHTYSDKGILTGSEVNTARRDEYPGAPTRRSGARFEYLYDASGRLAKLNCYSKDGKNPYYIFEYSYNEKGMIAGVKWYNGWKNELEMYYDYTYDGRGNCVSVKCPAYLLAEGREDAKLENTFKYDDSNRVTDIVYYNWIKREDPPKPDSLIRFSYDAKTGLLSETEIEPVKMYPGNKYSFKYSYEFF